MVGLRSETLPMHLHPLDAEGTNECYQNDKAEQVTTYDNFFVCLVKFVW